MLFQENLQEFINEDGLKVIEGILEMYVRECELSYRSRPICKYKNIYQVPESISLLIRGLKVLPLVEWISGRLSHMNTLAVVEVSFSC